MQTDLASVVVSDFPRLSKPEQSEIDLMRAIAQGDKRAMHLLFAKHRLGVYRFALRLVDEKEAAEDLVSEAFLNVWRHAGRFEGRCRSLNLGAGDHAQFGLLDVAPAPNREMGRWQGRRNSGSC